MLYEKFKISMLSLLYILIIIRIQRIMSKRQPLNKNRQRDIMKDFDVLATVKNSQKQLYKQANLEDGLNMMATTYVSDEQGQKFDLFVSIQSFKQFGPGIYLLFLFLKYATIIFLVVSIISFINLGVLIPGDRLNIQNHGFQNSIAETSLGNVKSNQIAVIITFDYIIIVILLVALIYWKEKQASFVVQCCQDTMLPSYSTIILKTIPDLYTETDMKNFIDSRFGTVEQIYTVRDFHNDLFHYKEITDIVRQFKQERTLVTMENDRSPIKLTKLYLQFRRYQAEMKKSQNNKYIPCFAFIMFDTVASRERMLKFYQNQYFWKSEEEKKNFKYKSQQIQIQACMMEPNGIRWENLSLSTGTIVFRIIVQITLLMIVFLISSIFIFILYISQSSMSNNKYTHMTKQQIFKDGSDSAIKSYCLNLSISAFNSAVQCQKYSGLYVKYIFLFILLPLSITIFKFILTQLMKALVYLRRHPYQIAKIQSQIVIMFVFYFFATGILQLLVFLQIQFDDGSSISFTSILNPIQNALLGFLQIDSSKLQLYTDFTREWYIAISQKVVLIAMISFNASALGKIAYSYILRFVCHAYAKRKRLQVNMNEWLKGQTLQIQFVYAVAATIICFTLLFGGNIPLVYPFATISLFILFWSTKFIFIKFCAKPLLYSHSMNSLLIKILFFGIVMHCLVTPLFLGADTIYQNKNIKNFLRIPYFGYYIAIIVIAIVYQIFRQFIIGLCKKAQNYYYEYRDFQYPQNPTKHQSLPSKLCMIQHTNKTSQFSYSMHESEQYEDVLKTLYTINKKQRIRATFVLHQKLNSMIFQAPKTISKIQINLLQQEKSQNQQNSSVLEAQASQIKNKGKRKEGKLFNQILNLTKIVHKNHDRRVGKNYQQRNPFQGDLKILLQIKKASQQQQKQAANYGPIEYQDFQLNSLKKLTNLDLQYLHNLASNSKIKQRSKFLQVPSSVQPKINSRSDMRHRTSLAFNFLNQINLNQIMERSQEESFSRKYQDQKYDQGAGSDVRINLGMQSKVICQQSQSKEGKKSNRNSDNDSIKIGIINDENICNQIKQDFSQKSQANQNKITRTTNTQSNIQKIQPLKSKNK